MQTLPDGDRLRLQALRYATVAEADQYLAVMRVFTRGTAGLMSDLSAAEVARHLTEHHGVDLDPETVESRLSYLVEHGNLARSPRETAARSIREYLTSRARYQLTQRGELAHRQVEELLASTDGAREVSTEMLGGILATLTWLDAAGDPASLAPEELSTRVATLFAQFERLVTSTREFYSHLGGVLTRYDLDRDQFQAYKGALIDYLQRFVDDVARHVPQVGDTLLRVEPRLPALLARANTGTRLVDVTGQAARRSLGLDAADWAGLRAWFVSGDGREADATQVRRLATQAMRALIVNLRRIAGPGLSEGSRYTDLLRLAGWFAAAEQDDAHALWAAAFGLYPCRHLAFTAAEGADPVPATASWWRAPVADVPVPLVTRGERTLTGRPGRRADFSAAKGRRLAHLAHVEAERRAALAELAGHPGSLDGVRLGERARSVLLELHARAVTTAAAQRSGAGRASDGRPQTAVPLRAADRGSGVGVLVVPAAGASTTVTSPAGTLTFVDLRVEVEVLPP